MKKILFAACSISLSIGLFAQNEQQREAEVRAMEVVESQALLEKDIPTLQKVWSPTFMVNAPLNMVFIGGQIDLVKSGILSYTSFSRNIEQVMVLKDVVITMGSETVVPSGLDPLAGQTIERRYTNIWMKEKNTWVLVARHANNICPVSTNTTTSTRKIIDKYQENTLKIKVRNNPSTHHFELNFDNPDKAVEVRISDNNGRLIERLQIPKGFHTISVGEKYPGGIYFAQLSNGRQLNGIKLIKL